MFDRSPQQAPRRSASPDDAALDVVDTALPVLVSAVVLASMLASMLFFVLFAPAPAVDTLFGALTGPKTFWYLTRSSAFIAYLFLWWSMALGLVITNRMARAWPGGPTVTNLHEHASLAGLAFGALHALVLLGDHYVGYSLEQVLVPFTSTYRPLWVGVGQIALYLSVIVTVTFYLRRWVIGRAWRAIHYLSFAAFAMALAHGIWSGSDSGASWAFWLYAFSGLSLVGLTVYRIMLARRSRAGAERLSAVRP